MSNLGKSEKQLLMEILELVEQIKADLDKKEDKKEVATPKNVKK